VVEEIILVDESDREIGFAEKLAAHRDGGRLHRAFSIFLFDAQGRMLLQKRAAAKYHFGGLWTNACCGHPRRGEVLEAAARRRLREELGVGPELREVFTFVYTAADPGSGLTEREFDHVFVGRLLDEQARPDPAEIDALRWIDSAELSLDVAAQPERYTPWFAQALERLPELRAALG
jgi:isopentenyl-diphosphate delta-isomerase